tara:strand:- start:362 stop:1147 length:786 start_codon:yes stop_codon:yes gene_type:complete
MDFIRRHFIYVLILFCPLMLSAIVKADALVATVKLIKPSIVGVGTYMPTRRPAIRLLATGFSVGTEQLVVTNNHVITFEINTEKLERLVVFSGVGNSAKMHKAVLVSSSSEHDLALLRVDARIPPMVLASSDQMLSDGASVAFTGFPIGSVLGLYPVTHRGMISAITPIAIPSSSSQQLNAKKIRSLRDPFFVYQLDATAYPGNSGSPLYRPDTGEVIGILNMVFIKSTKEDVLSNPSGISYAIPVKHLRSLLQDLEQAKR